MRMGMRTGVGIGLLLLGLAAAGGCQSIMRELDLRFGPDEP